MRVTWKRNLNTALTRATGLEVRRAGSPSPAPKPKSKPGARKRRGNDRLVARPAFVLCTLRSGSTLLRVLINSHSQLHAPHEIHLRYISASIEKKPSERSMKEMGLDEQGLTY